MCLQRYNKFHSNRELIIEEVHSLEKFEHAVRYGKRALFIKQKQINLYGRQAYAYIVLDPDRKGREILLTMKNLKCKVYQDEIVVQELTKQQKEIVEKLNIIVPERAGI